MVIFFYIPYITSDMIISSCCEDSLPVRRIKYSIVSLAPGKINDLPRPRRRF